MATPSLFPILLKAATAGVPFAVEGFDVEVAQDPDVELEAAVDVVVEQVVDVVVEPDIEVETT